MKDRHTAFPYILLAIVLATLILFEWMNLVQENSQVRGGYFRSANPKGVRQAVQDLKSIFLCALFR